MGWEVRSAPSEIFILLLPIVCVDVSHFLSFSSILPLQNSFILHRRFEGVVKECVVDLAMRKCFG